MVYLDWSGSEDARIEGQVAQGMEGNSLDTGRRDVGEIWRQIEKDIEEQELLYRGS